MPREGALQGNVVEDISVGASGNEYGSGSSTDSNGQQWARMQRHYKHDSDARDIVGFAEEALQ